MRPLSGVSTILLFLIFFVILSMLVDYEEDFLDYLGDIAFAFFIVFFGVRILSRLRK